MVFLRWLIGGLIGAVLGAVVWVGIGYALNAEVGYVAWGIGLLCGIGVQVVGGQEDGYMPGIVAVVCAAASILVSKYLVVSMLMNGAMAEMPEMIVTDSDMIASYAEEIIVEQEEKGKRVKLPPTYEDDEAPVETQYPPTIWRAAKKRWDKLPESEKAAMMEERTKFMKDAMQHLQGAFKNQAFMESFNFFDVLWFGLAAFTAFRVGSGLSAGDE